MSPEKLAYMANQIGRFFAHQPRAEAVDSIKTHLKKFWDPRMRAEIVERVDDPALGLDELAREAVRSLREGDRRKQAT